MRITQDDIDNWFRYHSPAGDQQELYRTIREAGGRFASAILELTPPSADQSAAIRKVREAVMTANAAIACSDGWDGSEEGGSTGQTWDDKCGRCGMARGFHGPVLAAAGEPQCDGFVEP